MKVMIRLSINIDMYKSVESVCRISFVIWKRSLNDHQRDVEETGNG